MANEITINALLQFINGNFELQHQFAGQFDQAAPGGGAPGTVTVGTSEEDITYAEITTPGWLFMRNLDTTNYVQWGPKSGGSMVTMGRMEAGEPVLFRLDPGVTIIRAIANTAACKVLVAVNFD